MLPSSFLSTPLNVSVYFYGDFAVCICNAGKGIVALFEVSPEVMAIVGLILMTGRSSFVRSSSGEIMLKTIFEKVARALGIKRNCLKRLIPLYFHFLEL